MAFRNLMARLGSGVATVLDSPTTTPGGTVTGAVHLTGGTVAQEVNEIRVALEATVEVESGDSSWREDATFGSTVVAGRGRVEPGARHSFPFTFAVPWQCPITSIDGWHLRGMRIGLRTRVDVPGAVDPGDLDPVTVLPLPVQRAVLLALDALASGSAAPTWRRAASPAATCPSTRRSSSSRHPASAAGSTSWRSPSWPGRTAWTSCWRSTGAEGCSPRATTSVHGCG